MIKHAILLFSLSAILLVSCDTGEYDTKAIASLDKLTETIGELNSASYTTYTYQVLEDSTETTKESDVYLRGPNKMYVHSNGTKGERSLYYNGEEFAYYDYDKNHYDTLAAPKDILLAIDFVHEKYEIDFPASDFLYPSLTDDIIENFSSVMQMKDETIDDVECLHIEASNDDTIVLIWIEKKTHLPYRMIIESSTNDRTYYEVTFANWRLNPKLPDILFEFDPSGDAKRVSLLDNY